MGKIKDFFFEQKPVEEVHNAKNSIMVGNIYLNSVSAGLMLRLTTVTGDILPPILITDQTAIVLAQMIDQHYHPAASDPEWSGEKEAEAKS